MWRFVAGSVSALLLAGAGIILWRGADAESPIPPAPAALTASAQAPSDDADPPAASEKTREEKRFSRYDKDRNGAVAREEYLAARRKAFARLDANGDGRLGFEEYAVKTVEKFAKADADKTGALTPIEFATTRVIRKPSLTPRCDCRETGATRDESE